MYLKNNLKKKDNFNYSLIFPHIFNIKWVLLLIIFLGSFSIISDFNYCMNMRARDAIDFLAKENDIHSALFRMISLVTFCIIINEGTIFLSASSAFIIGAINLFQNIYL